VSCAIIEQLVKAKGLTRARVGARLTAIEHEAVGGCVGVLVREQVANFDVKSACQPHRPHDERDLPFQVDSAVVNSDPNAALG
jgi:hypothetical protein